MAQYNLKKTEEETAPRTSRIQTISLLKSIRYVEENIMKDINCKNF